MNRNAWIRGAEIVFVLPATAFLAPMATFSAVGMMFAIVQDVRLGLVTELMLIGVMVSSAAAVAGMISLWMAMMLSAELLAGRPALRVGLVMESEQASSTRFIGYGRFPINEALAGAFGC